MVSRFMRWDIVLQGNSQCMYGDRDSMCKIGMDCSLSVVRDLCCDTCAGYAIPNVVIGESLPLNP